VGCLLRAAVSQFGQLRESTSQFSLLAIFGITWSWRHLARNGFLKDSSSNCHLWTSIFHQTSLQGL
jgi:hypothetical protein